MDKSDLQLQTGIETRLGPEIPPNQVHEVLGVSRTSWLEYRSGIRPMPKYVRCSIEAHMALDESKLGEMIEARGVKPKPATRRGRPSTKPAPEETEDLTDLLD